MSFFSRMKLYPTSLMQYHRATHINIHHSKLLWRNITTSSKGRDVDSISIEADAKPIVPKKKVRNWQSMGFDFVDQRVDIAEMHFSSFLTITILLWGTIFLMAYYPDMGFRNWAFREACILVRERELLGLPLLDPNYVDPSTIILPPEEELDDSDIII